MTKTPKRQCPQSDPVLQTNKFIYYNHDIKKTYSINEFLNIVFEIVLQNCPTILRHLSVCEVSQEGSEGLFLEPTKVLLATKPFVSTEYIQKNSNEISGKYQVILTDDSIIEKKNFSEYLLEDGFVICKGSSAKESNNSLTLIFQGIVDGECFYLLRKCSNIVSTYATVNIQNTNFSWINELNTHLLNADVKIVYLISQNEEGCGILGLINCLNKEPINCKLKMIFTDDKSGTFSMQDDFYKEQLSKNLVYNIARNNAWGTYVYVPLNQVAKTDVFSANVDIGTLGNLSTLNWTEAPPTYHW